MGRTKAMTLAEHRALGKRIKAMRNEAVKILVELGSRYPTSGKICKLAKKTEMAIGDFRSALDDQVGVDLKGDNLTAKELNGFYYGPDEER